MLARAVVVERPHDHDGKPVRDEVRVGETVGAGLRGRVRAPRIDRMLFVHGRGLRSTVDLARREQDEPLDRGLADRIEENLCPLDIRRDEFTGALFDRLLDVRFGRGVHDHVHLGDDVAHEVGVSNVALNEREPFVRHCSVQVVKIARVRERVERHDLVWCLGQEVVDEVGRDESRPARDENAFDHAGRLRVRASVPYGELRKTPVPGACPEISEPLRYGS